MNLGSTNTTGMNNAFFGFGAGQSNTEGTSNSFFGASAGAATTTGVLNAFFGYRAGLANTNIAGNPFAGSFNSFFGAQAGEKNTTGAFNSFFGYIAGQNTTVGGGNSFFGRWAGQNNISGNDNVFLGDGAGLSNINGSDNMAIGAFSKSFRKRSSLSRSARSALCRSVASRKTTTAPETRERSSRIGVAFSSIRIDSPFRAWRTARGPTSAVSRSSTDFNGLAQGAASPSGLRPALARDRRDLVHPRGMAVEVSDDHRLRAVRDLRLDLPGIHPPIYPAGHR